jgi:hypothetical protein
LLSQIERLDVGVMRQSRMMLKLIRAHEDRIHDIPNLTRGLKDKRVGDLLAYNDKRVQDALKFLAYGSLFRGSHIHQTLSLQKQLLLEFLDTNAFPPYERNAAVLKTFKREWFQAHHAHFPAVHKSLVALPCLCSYESSIQIQAPEALSKATLIETILANLHHTTRHQIHKLLKPAEIPPRV